MAKYALIVGISEYESLKLLPGAIRDAKEVSKVLQNPNLGGFCEENITVLENPDRAEVEEAIYELFDDREKNDLILFYFAGHGITDALGQLYLAVRRTYMKKKGELKKLKDITAISAKYLQERMTQSFSEQQIIILDCCFSGAFSKGMNARNINTINLESLGGRGRAVLASSTSTQYSYEHHDSGFGVYTHYLLEGIQKGTADNDKDGWISVDELHDYISTEVKRYCIEHCIDPPMTPEIYSVKQGYKIRIAKAGNISPTFISFSSPINNKNLNTGFIWYEGNSINNKYYLCEDSSVIITTIGHTDQSGDEFSAPLISYYIKGDFEAEVQVKFKSIINYQRACFGIRLLADQYAYLRIYITENRRVEIAFNKLINGRLLALLDYENDVVFFKIRKYKNKIRFFYSCEGNENEWLSPCNEQQVDIGDETELYLSVLSAHNSEEALAEFSRFKITYL
jgi:hypothetical protein